MDLITSHTNTDFDGLAAMVAALRLYPRARLAVPGPVAPGVGRFLSLHKDIITVARPADIDTDLVRRLIIVDTARAARLGEFSELATKPGLELHIFDHHPSEPDNLTGAVTDIQAVGATTTLLVERIEHRRTSLDPIEASLFALGIYSDTGCLLYGTTTVRDVRAVAFLLDQGARLDVVDSFLERDLTSEQHEVLAALVTDLKPVTAAGIAVGVATARVADYVPGLAVIAHKLIDITQLPAVVLVVAMSGRTYLVARSVTDDLDVSAMLARWGGRGHRSAASAVIRNDDLESTTAAVRAEIVKHIQPGQTARDIMSSPVRTVTDDCPVTDALDLLERYGHSGLPVTDADGALVGIVSRRDLDKAKRHELGHAPVRGFMSRQVITAGSDTPVNELRQTMVAEDKGRLPVVDQGELIGIVTRTDVLRELYGNKRASAVGPAPVQAVSRRRNVSRLLAGLSPDVQRLIKQVRIVAGERREQVYLVGGIVRDLLLGVKNWDVDLVVEGDGPGFARGLKELIGGRLQVFDPFGTATVIARTGLATDIGGARREHYERAAALPTVERGTLREDLARRDFSINALAVQLTGRAYGELIDLFGGRRDLVQQQIRVLHNLSFIDDPTRLFRMVRFEHRLGFQAAPDTERFAREAVERGLVGRLSGDRFTAELLLVCEEVDPGPAIVRLADLGLVSGLEPLRTAEVAGEVARALAAARHYRFDRDPSEPMVCILGIWWALSEPERDGLRSRLRLNRHQQEVLLAAGRLEELVAAVNGDEQRDSAVVELLQEVPQEIVIMTWALASAAGRSRIDSYWASWQRVQLAVSGHDLIRHGFRPGPLFRETLDALKRELVDGLEPDRDTQLAFALDYIERRYRDRERRD